MGKKSILFASIIMLFNLAVIMQVSATTTLTVNSGTVLRGATHCATGSLYGVTESKPSDIAGLVAPLNPFVFTNPARAGSGYQQPIGAAITVAGRLTSTTGKVMIRLADIYPNWPYAFTNMTDWLNKVTSVINDKKASGYSNFYGYEIWNEPDGTWNSGNGDFNSVLWKQTYDKIRSLDSGAQIIGPSYSYYSQNTMNTFMTYAKNNNCLPDVICWHELGGPANIANNINNYRSIESSLGISARKISINEYGDSDHNLEGQPGSCARFMGKFERYKVDSACISWWFTGAPGRLGSLLANDSGGKGAGWYFYKWYGDMSGNMVSTTAPNENSTNMDGCACVDGNTVTVLFGGPNDGTCAVNINGLPSGIGSTANVLVQRVDWTNKDTVSSGIVTMSQSEYTISGGSISVMVSGTNNSSGYRLYVTSGSATAAPTAIPTIAPTAAPTGVVNGSISIACGSSSAVGSFQPDQYYSGGSTYNNTNTVDISQITENPPPAALFNNERYGAMSYTIPGFTTGSSYTVTLYFAETYLTSGGGRVLNVSINGASALSNFDIYASAGGQNKAIARSFTTTADSSGQIVIQFTAVTENPKINGIGINPGSNNGTLGDVNGSGTIDIVDALLVAQYYVGLAPQSFDVAFADVNCSGSIDIVDALLIAQYYVGLISTFPC